MISAVRHSLDSIREKIECGERLSPKEAEGLWDESVDLHELGELANLVQVTTLAIQTPRLAARHFFY